MNEFEIQGKLQVFLAVCDGIEKFMLPDTAIWANLCSVISVPKQYARVVESKQNHLSQLA